jgi:collagen type VI alpha
VAAIVYSDESTVKFTFNDASVQGSKESVLNALAFSATPGATDTAAALQDTVELFSAVNGDRTGVDNVVVIMTDGDTNVDPELAEREMEDLQNAGVRVIAVGLGERPNRKALEQMSSSPSTENLFYMRKSSAIVSTADDVINALCV